MTAEQLTGGLAPTIHSGASALEALADYGAQLDTLKKTGCLQPDEWLVLDGLNRLIADRATSLTTVGTADPAVSVAHLSVTPRATHEIDAENQAVGASQEAEVTVLLPRQLRRMISSLEHEEPADSNELEDLVRRLIATERAIPRVEGGKHAVSYGLLRERCFELLVQREAGMLHNILQPFLAKSAKPYSELRSVALLGLSKAFKRFDPERGTRFISYAWRTIDGELKRYLRDETLSGTVLTRKVMETIINIEKLEDDGYDDAKIADLLGISIDEVEETRYLVQTQFSNESYDDPDSLCQVGEDATSRQAFLNLEVSDAAAQILGVLDGMDLTDRDLQILEHMFGITQGHDGAFTIAAYGSWHQQSQAVVGQTIGFSQMHISRLTAQVVRRIQTELGITENE